MAVWLHARKRTAEKARRPRRSGSLNRLHPWPCGCTPEVIVISGHHCRCMMRLPGCACSDLYCMLTLRSLCTSDAAGEAFPLAGSPPMTTDVRLHARMCAQVFGLLDMQEQVEGALAGLARSLESTSAASILADFTQLVAMLRAEARCCCNTRSCTVLCGSTEQLLNRCWSQGTPAAARQPPLHAARCCPLACSSVKQTQPLKPGSCATLPCMLHGTVHPLHAAQEQLLQGPEHLPCCRLTRRARRWRSSRRTSRATP
jgi:hypothetical protein